MGIPDEQFIRSEGVPMTKNEIRVLSIAKLQLFSKAIVYDIGAGSGSVAIESKLIVTEGEVFAIEKEQKAVEVIKQNCKRFAATLRVIEGEAPEALKNLPMADRIFIGGSGGNLEKIIRTCDTKLTIGGRIILNSVTLTSATDAYKLWQSMGYLMEATQINVAQIVTRGSSEMWIARNPVTIISAEKSGG